MDKGNQHNTRKETTKSVMTDHALCPNLLVGVLQSNTLTFPSLGGHFIAFLLATILAPYFSLATPLLFPGFFWGSRRCWGGGSLHFLGSQNSNEPRVREEQKWYVPEQLRAQHPQRELRKDLGPRDYSSSMPNWV